MNNLNEIHWLTHPGWRYTAVLDQTMSERERVRARTIAFSARARSGVRRDLDEQALVDYLDYRIPDAESAVNRITSRISGHQRFLQRVYALAENLPPDAIFIGRRSDADLSDPANPLKRDVLPLNEIVVSTQRVIWVTLRDMLGDRLLLHTLEDEGRKIRGTISNDDVADIITANPEATHYFYGATWDNSLWTAVDLWQHSGSSASSRGIVNLDLSDFWVHYEFSIAPRVTPHGSSSGHTMTPTEFLVDSLSGDYFCHPSDLREGRLQIQLDGKPIGQEIVARLVTNIERYEAEYLTY